MFLGNDVFLWVAICGALTLAFVAVGLLYIGESIKYGTEIFSKGKPPNKVVINYQFSGIQGWSYMFLVELIPAGVVAVAAAYATMFYGETQKNFKNVFLFSTFYIFFGWVVMDLFVHFLTRVQNIEYVDGSRPMVINRPSINSAFNTTLYYFAHITIWTYMCMMVACLYSFNDTTLGITVQATSPIQLLSPFLCGGVAVIGALLIVRTTVYDRLYDPETIAKIAEQTVSLGGMQYAAAMKAAEKYGPGSVPLQFGPTGDKLHNPSVPENRALLEIDRKVKAEGAKYGLSLKNYQVLNLDDKFIALSSDTDRIKHFVNTNPMTEVGLIKYGLMATEVATENTENEVGKFILSDKEVKKTVSQMYTPAVKENTLLLMSSDRIPKGFSYHENIMGLGVGRGTWLHIPWWFLFLVFMVELPVYCQIMGDGGAALSILFVTSVPTLLVSLMGPDNGTFQLFAWGKVVGWGVMLLANEIVPGKPTYIFKDAVMETTTYWLQYSSYVSPAEAAEVNIFGWVSLANVASYMISAALILIASARVMERQESA